MSTWGLIHIIEDSSVMWIRPQPNPSLRYVREQVDQIPTTLLRYTTLPISFKPEPSLRDTSPNRWITAKVEGRFPSHSAVRREVFNGAGGELGVEGINLWDQGQQNRTRGEVRRELDHLVNSLQTLSA